MNTATDQLLRLILNGNCFFVLLLFNTGFAQSPCSTLGNYIPTGNEPELVVRVKLHVIQYSSSDPRNYTLADTTTLKKQFEWINLFFREMESPTLLPDQQVDHLRDARFQFEVAAIQFYTDAKKWDRLGIRPAENRLFPTVFDSVAANGKEIWMEGNQSFRFNNTRAQFRAEGLNDLDIEVDTCIFFKHTKKSVIRLKQPLPGGYHKGKITFYLEDDRNCSDDLFRSIGASDSNYLHVFYTGSSGRNMAFGCGPSPYYLNLSNFTKGGEWANAQLAAHELGHCLGLSHTDYPQFDDLPKTDRFGFIDCDSISVSNNIMGYNKCRRYLSPKQIAFVHQEYALKPHRIRTTASCIYNSEKTWYIRRNTTWNRAMVIGGDLVIRKGKTLTVHCMVSLSEGAHIILEEGATLILNGNVITNNCGDTWNGVLYCRKFSGNKNQLKAPKKKKGELILQNGGRLERIRIN